MKKLIFPIISIFILFPTMVVLIALLATGKVCISYNGLAVDKYSNLYVARGSDIDVYNENRDYIRSIHIVSGELGKGYSFTIFEGDKILVNSGNYYDLMDLHGNVLKEIDISEVDEPLYLSSSISKTRFTAEDGSVYRMVKAFDGTKVYRIKDGETTLVYTAPIGDTIAAIAFGVHIPWTFAVVLYCVIYGRKMLGFKDHEWGGF